MTRERLRLGKQESGHRTPEAQTQGQAENMALLLQVQKHHLPGSEKKVLEVTWWVVDTDPRKPLCWNREPFDVASGLEVQPSGERLPHTCDWVPAPYCK